VENLEMKKIWSAALKSCADPPRARRRLEQLAAVAPALKQFSADSARVLVTLLSGSQFLGGFLAGNSDCLSVLDFERLKFPRRKQGFQREVDELLAPKLDARDDTGALGGLRRFKQREMLRIAARDLARLGDVVEITRELSDLADVCLNAVLQICQRQLMARFGQPFHQDANGRWQPTTFCVLGLGKLGGQELNYSSDVDLIFIYEDEGEVFKVPPVGTQTSHAVMSSHQLFSRLAETFTFEVSRATLDGFLFRVDLRLRPESDAGPIARSLESCENYYAQWGQTWERMMLIKARGVAGDRSLAAEFLEMIQPFRFPRSISPDILREIAATKDRLENEVVGAEELEHNVKLGRGGIREIEFIVQSRQVLRAGQSPFLEIPQTLPCLEKLAQYNLLARDEAGQLDAAYRFLRDVEHRLQMEDNLQTHTIPRERRARLRLARLMNFKSLEKFQSALQTHTGNVRRVYDKLFKAEPNEAQAGLLPSFGGAEAEWKDLLAERSFREPDKAFSLLKEFAEGPGYVHVSPRTTELARRLIPKFLELCPAKSPKSKAQSSKPKTSPVNVTLDFGHRTLNMILSDPDRVLARLDSFISNYGSRSTLFELWNNNPKLFELLLLLFDRSEFLAETAIRAPDLVDNLVSGGRLRQRKSAPESLRELHFGLSDADQFLWLRRYHETERMRLGLRDILGLADFEQNLAELSALADACLQYALETVMRKNKIKSPPFAIIGLGKLGGRELDYGSDLDVVFVAASEKKLPKLQRLAAEVLELLSRRTEQGIVCHVDARLRPDGEKGLLVQALAACENYYRTRAQLWEIQTLTRARFVAGDSKIGRQFEKLAATLTDFSKVRRVSLVCFTPEWKRQIHQMRLRVEKERTSPGQGELAIKTGRGGLMDAEFIAQVLCLENGWHEPNTLRALERARENNILPDAKRLIENYRCLRRVEGILRRWSYEGETVLPEDAPAFYRVSVRCGFESPEKFRTVLGEWRKAIRKVFTSVFEAKRKDQKY
jgi:[glutamine synthetase] adenylyltransferase / [glutamine synthetase]-adenylyl-L-tyrosine phosphorylase